VGRPIVQPAPLTVVNDVVRPASPSVVVGPRASEMKEVRPGSPIGPIDDSGRDLAIAPSRPRPRPVIVFDESDDDDDEVDGDVKGKAKVKKAVRKFISGMRKPAPEV
jgi:hypothetical protein